MGGDETLVDTKDEIDILCKTFIELEQMKEESIQKLYARNKYLYTITLIFIVILYLLP